MTIVKFLVLLGSFWAFSGGAWMLSEHIVYPAIERRRQRKREQRIAKRLMLERSAKAREEQENAASCYRRLQEIKENAA